MPKTRVSIQDEMWFAGTVRFLGHHVVHPYHYLMDEETEAQRGEGNCLRPHRKCQVSG